jgi:predicted alpha/beta-hydrolase family hydrolase
MARRLRIEWHSGRKITARFEVPASPRGPAILLAHGAGAGQNHPFMTGLRSRLAAAGHPTLTFDYPYMEAGRRAPDRMPRLLACHRAVLHRLRGYGWPIVLAGKSMGGRMASHLAVEDPALGLVFYGYPLVSPSQGTVRSTDHLSDAGLPMLFLAGSRDRLAPLDRLRPVVERLPRASLEVIEDGDHSFRVPKRIGLSEGEILDRLALATTTEIRRW